MKAKRILLAALCLMLISAGGENHSGSSEKTRKAVRSYGDSGKADGRPVMDQG